MKRLFWGALTVALAFAAAAPARAQVIDQTERFTFGLGLGATMPMGNYGDLDKMGLNLLGVFEFPMANSPLYLRADGLYSSTGHEGVNGSTAILGGTASALYHFSAPNAQARPYILGGVGVFNVDPGADAQTKLGFAFGGGVTFNLAGFNAFAEARYLSIQTSGNSSTLIPISVGLLFGY